MLPETLPGCADKQLVTYVMTECLDTDGESEADSDEVPVHVMWCVALCYTDPDTEFPACILVSSSFIHIFAIDSLTAADGGSYPILRRVFYIPLATLQRVAIGYYGLYVQVEESQVGERGAYTLLTMNSRKTDLFIDSLKRAVRHTIPDLDAYEDPNIVSVDDVCKVLAPVLSEYELPGCLSIKLYMLIVTKNGDQAENFATRSLLVSSRHIYLLKQDYVSQPAPTFILSTSAARPSFEVLDRHLSG